MERRCYQALELRSDAKSGKPVLSGYAAVFNSRSLPIPERGGSFIETVKPGAFRRSLAEHDVIALVEHTPHMVMGRKGSGTLRVWEDSRGLAIELDPPDTSYGRDLVVSVARGDIVGMSFGFDTKKDEWRSTSQGDLRELIDVDLHEVTFTAFPYYQASTLDLRSYAAFTAEQHMRMRMRLR